jgi:hypothetical protein
MHLKSLRLYADLSSSNVENLSGMEPSWTFDMTVFKAASRSLILIPPCVDFRTCTWEFSVVINTWASNLPLPLCHSGSHSV